MQTKLCLALPDLAQHTILEFLDYNLRRGKYIKKLPKDLPVYNLILNRPEVEEKYYNNYDYHTYRFINRNVNEDGSCYYCDEDGCDSYFLISIVTKFSKRKSWVEHTMEIKYSYYNRNSYDIDYHIYDYDFDGSRHIGR